MAIRKTTQQIRDEILSQLEKGPLSVEQLRRNIEDSNWYTIKKYLDGLKTEKAVREVVSTEKIKIYQKVVDDTYFGLPLTEKQRKEFRTLFSMIIGEYNRHNKEITKTKIAKCAVYVIENEEAGLKDLPIVWYLYGMIPLMAVDLDKSYQEECSLEHKTKIRNLIEEYVKENGDKGSSRLAREQHLNHDEKLYNISDKIFGILNEPKINPEDLNQKLNEFFIACPIGGLEFPELFDLAEKVLSTIQKIILLNLDIGSYRKEVLLSFDSLWKYVALYKFYQSVVGKLNNVKKEVILNFYLGPSINERKRNLEESFSDLYSVYYNKLGESNEKPDKEIADIRNIMEDWTGE